MVGNHHFHPWKNCCLGFQVTIHEITSSEKNAAYQDHTRSPSCSPLQLQRTTRLVKTQKPHENVQAGVLFINGAEVLQSTNPVRSCWSSKRFVSIREHSWRRSNYTDLEQKIINRPKCLPNCSKKRRTCFRKSWKCTHKKSSGMTRIPFFTRFYTSQVVVWDLFHQFPSTVPLWKKGFEATKSFSISVCCIIHSQTQFLGEKNVLFHPWASILHWEDSFCNKQANDTGMSMVLSKWIITPLSRL